jgi:hypothetical protein
VDEIMSLELFQQLDPARRTLVEGQFKKVVD